MKLIEEHNVCYNLQQDSVDDSGYMYNLDAYRKTTRIPGLLLSALIALCVPGMGTILWGVSPLYINWKIIIYGNS